MASDRLLVHDRGRVLADLACAVADGAWQRGKHLRRREP
jgi:hypothetical protein